jgi:hypothetical protein
MLRGVRASPGPPADERQRGRALAGRARQPAVESGLVLKWSGAGGTAACRRALRSRGRMACGLTGTGKKLLLVGVH